MYNTLKQYLAGLGSESDRRFLMPLLSAMADRFSTQTTSSAGLVITGGGGTTAKIGATAYQGVVKGIPVTIAAGTSMPALTGLNISAGAFNVFCFFIDAASTVTVLQGTEGATLTNVRFPQFPEGKALVGYLIVTNASAFTGGTTALDAATTNYVSHVAAFDPTVLLG